MADHACPDCGAVHKEKRTSLKQRVEMLEARVASLEARVPQWTYTYNGYPWITTTGDSSIPITQPND